MGDFPCGPVVKTSLSNAGGAGSIPGQGTKIPHVLGHISPHITTTESAYHRKDPEQPKKKKVQNLFKKCLKAINLLVSTEL